KCLNNCGWKASPGDDNWPFAVQMLKKTTNTASASEVSSMVLQNPQFDPKLSTTENWAKIGLRYNSYYDRLEKFKKEEEEKPVPASVEVEEKAEEKKEENTEGNKA